MVWGGEWWWANRSKEVKVSFCNVGQGQMTIITSGKFQMLIDTGPDNGEGLDCLEKMIPRRDKEIEVVIVSHWDKDHSGGLTKISKYYKICSLYSSTRPKGDNEQIYYTDNLSRGDIISYSLIDFEVLSPDQNWGDDNDNSIIGCLKYKDKKVLIMGDVSKQVEERLTWRNGWADCKEVNILEVSHHGAATATGEELLKGVKPKSAIISVGIKNKFGHPSKEVLERLQENNINIWRTDEKGEIIFEWN